MVDLRDGEAKLSEPVLLRKKTRELTLHAGELALGDADFVHAPGQRHDAALILWVLGEAQHVARQSRQRLHEETAQREVDDRRGEQRQDDRQPKDVHSIAHHRLFERRLRNDDLDKIVVVGARCDRRRG